MTNIERQHREFSTDTMGYVCGVVQEDVEHVFQDCSTTKEVKMRKQDRQMIQDFEKVAVID